MNIDWNKFIEHGMISEGDLELMTFSSDLDEVEKIIIDHLSELPEVEPRAP